MYSLIKAILYCFTAGFEVSSRPNISVQVGNTPDTPTPCDFVHQHVEEGSGTTWTTKTATFTCSPPVEGRYVSLSDLGEMARQCEVEVYARNTQGTSIISY